MGESLHCDICGNPATVHYTQIVKNQIQKVDLCEECAKTKGVTDPEGFSLAELLGKSFAGLTEGDSTEEVSADLICEQCGYAPVNFKKTGRLGCACCYDHLRPVVMPLIEDLHKGHRHRGKIPLRQLGQILLRREIEGLEYDLLKAVKEENFEAAADCRNRLSALRAQLAPPIQTK
jgi:protein arginine kinase activator